MEFKDYYATLGVAKTASDKEIKQAFRKLARKHHPDVNPGDKAAEAKFKEINEANEVLSDPGKRAKYDELGANWRMYEQGGGAGPQGGWSPGFGGAPGAGSGHRTMTEEEIRDIFGSGGPGDPFSDFFHTFFSGGARGDESGRTRGSRSRAPRKGRDVESEIELTLEDAFHGTTRQLSIKHDGHSRTVPVRIPAGVGEGSKVRIGGEGEPGTSGAASGDLYLRIHLAPHPRFERKGKDLFTHVTVPLTTVVLGGEVDVTTLGGRSLRLRVPATTQNAQVFRLKGHGIPNAAKPEESGDLYATVDVELPKALTPEQREHFEALQKLEKGAKSAAAAS
jgi:DnaJ-class molecular chaperone